MNRARRRTMASLASSGLIRGRIPSEAYGSLPPVGSHPSPGLPAFRLYSMRAARPPPQQGRELVMRIAIVGADFEENLGLGLIAASLEAARHRVHVVPFQAPDDTDQVVSRIRARKPAIVGLSVQFQHRAYEFLHLAKRLRARGFRGHLTDGEGLASAARGAGGGHLRVLQPAYLRTPHHPGGRGRERRVHAGARFPPGQLLPG
ncbi:MAG: cobalamin B12-binding domain-containing protein [Myxococcota bacterium]